MARFAKIAFALVLLLGLVSGAAFAAGHEFTLVNQTGADICKLYFAPAKSGDWCDNLLAPREVLKHGAGIALGYNPKDDKTVLFDIKAEDKSGRVLVWAGLNLAESRRVVLKADHEAECE